MKTKNNLKKEYIEINLSDLKPHPKNPKDHDLEAIKDSIKHNGALDPIEVDENNVILSGHGRWVALQELDYTKDKVIKYTGLTEKQKENYILRANTTTLGAGFLDEKLQLFDKDTLEQGGFGSHDIDRIFESEEDEEDTFNTLEELDKIKEPKIKEGEVYELGDSRLMCGDSTKKEDVDILMNGEKADMIFTDPPYNVNYKSQVKGGIMNDHMSEEKFIEFTMAFIERMKEALKAGGVYYICSGFSSYPPFRYALQELELEFSGPIVWVKNHTGLGWNDYRHKYELMLKAKNSKKKKAINILYGWNKGKHYFIEDRFESDVWEFKKRAGNTMCHPTQKPIGLINKAIKNSSKRGELVLDLFGGSGSTLISAEKVGRRANLMELDGKFCEIIIKRWEATTGKIAKKI